MTKKLAVFICITTICGCKRESRFLDVGREFFHRLDARQFDLAYEMITDRDKQSFDLKTFSEKMQRLSEDVWYPPNSDTLAMVIINRLSDSLFKPSRNWEGFYFLGDDTEQAYVVREIRRIPDLETLSSSIDEEDFSRQKDRIIRQKLVAGKYPTILDSSRFAVCVLENGEPKITVGARVATVHDSLSDVYRKLLRDSLFISIVGSGKIYRTTAHDVIGMLKYTVVNRTRDKLDFLVLVGEFGGRVTKPKLAEWVTPKSSVVEKIYFFDDFFHSLLGYSRDVRYIKADIYIDTYPDSYNHDQPDYDSVMTSVPNAPFAQFSNPIRQGVKQGLLY